MLRRVPLSLMLVFALFCSRAEAADKKKVPAPEVHSFRIHAQVNYRCYGGYEGKTVKDSHTGFVCDNKTYQKTLLDKTVKIEIKFEPNPGDEQLLVGDWDENNEFMGRKFLASLSMFKDAAAGKAKPYRLRVLAKDDEPNARESTTFVDFAAPQQMSTVTVDYSSRGTPEEIEYQLTVAPE